MVYFLMGTVYLNWEIHLELLGLTNSNLWRWEGMWERGDVKDVRDEVCYDTIRNMVCNGVGWGCA